MDRTRYIRLIIDITGVYVCFLLWAVLQERLTTVDYDGKKFKGFVSLNFLQSVFAFLVGTIYSYLQNGKKKDSNAKNTQYPISMQLNMAFIALLCSISSHFGYASLKYLDYPTLILGKSCKLLPVMAMHLIIYRSSFPPHKYLVVAMVTLGVTLFTYFHESPSSSASSLPESVSTVSYLWGLMLLSCNLLMDGYVNSTQDQIFKKFKLSGSQMMAMLNSKVALFTLCWLLYSGQAKETMMFLQLHPHTKYDMLLFSICGALGQVFVFDLIENFGSILLVTITLTRKIFTMLISVVWFNHELNFKMWTGIVLVFAGISLEAALKLTASPKPVKKVKSTQNGHESTKVHSS